LIIHCLFSRFKSPDAATLSKSDAQLPFGNLISVLSLLRFSPSADPNRPTRVGAGDTVPQHGKACHEVVTRGLALRRWEEDFTMSA
jgi:hypothetical protein